MDASLIYFSALSLYKANSGYIKMVGNRKQAGYYRFIVLITI